MAEIKKYLDTTALGALVDQIKAEDAKVKAYANTQIEAAGKLYDVAGAAATAEQNAKAYTDQLANGQVATNKADIAKLNGDATTEGSVAKAVADAKALVDADVDAVEAVANKNKEDIAAINNAETGILKQAKDYTDSQVSGVQEDVDNLSEFVGVIPEGYEATTIAAYAKELADNVAANGYDDTALAARVTKNEGDISALQTKDTELAAKDDELAAAIAAVKEDVDAFFADADMTESAKDTLKELQTYIASDETAASEMLASIKVNADAIDALETADGEQDAKIAALEAKFGGAEGSVEDMIADAKQEAIDAAASAADAKDAEILAQAKKYADDEDALIESRVAELETASGTHALKSEVEDVSGRVTTLEGEMDTAQADIDAVEALAAANKAAHEANAAAIALKASQADLEAAVSRIAQNETDIASLETAVAGKAAQSDLEAAVARIGTNETNIAANTSAINSFTAITSDEVNALFA